MNPLAYRMRPKKLNDVIGQDGIINQSWLINAIGNRDLPSMIFFGPPGVGKTSMATLIAETTGLAYKIFSAVTSTIKEVKEFIDGVYRVYQIDGKRTIVFIDEIHRFNKAQQDAFLPWIEKGVIILIGTTTENPSFYINAPLLSRVKVVSFQPLSPDSLLKILRNAVNDPAILRAGLKLSEEILAVISEFARDDARVALNALELVASNYSDDMTVDTVLQILSTNVVSHDKKGDAHYNVISAFIKSMRGSDPDASVYYLARMLEAGEDPYFILRRMLIFASEDIGNADPHALMIAVSAHYAFDVVGMPEGFIPLSNAVCYLALAPKSNASYIAYLKAKEDVVKYGCLTPPLAILNPVTKVMRDMGYGKGYKYPHDYEGGYVQGENYMPEKLKGRSYYKPKSSGHEKILLERLNKLKGRK
jgi:putative ATPase